MYEHLDQLLKRAKQKIRVEFNRLGMLGFDELNVTNTRRVTKALFDRLLSQNEKMYLEAADKAYSKAKKSAEGVGYREEQQSEIDGDWLLTILLAYNLVTGYLYDREAERKRLRLNEQILTAREYDDRSAYNDSLRRGANLWWTQTMQYGVDVVDEATVQAYRDMGVDKVRWVAELDSKTCVTCRSRNGKIYEIKKVPTKPHYNCRCYLEPVEIEE